MRLLERDTLWGTYDGRLIKIRDLEDTHLANIIKHVTTYSDRFSPALIATMKAEADLRGLSCAFLERAHIPFRNENGDWMVWSDEKHEPVKVG